MENVEDKEPDVAIDDDLNILLTTPKTFLESNAMIIYGSNKGGSCIKDFVLQATDKKGWKSWVGGTIKDVPFYVLYDADGFNAQGTGPKSRRLSAHYISMREFKGASWEDKSVTHYTLPVGPPPVMVTSKVNGCTFGIGSNADGVRLVSHLRPPGGDAVSRKQLDQGTRAGFGEGKLDVSIMSSQEMNGTILASQKGGNWEFYVQRFQMSSSAVGTIEAVHIYK